ncbi:aminotransferase class I/II-fold pyridoxal phosphate-dependent enzyme [Euhalothece natronophila Z-M001]|uniref:Aminotransferase class I/II-fold pyridoxal phosphate-dependent enzyme n=1 Tax=Euhalothece natronophila Z-M001 TaxID=522448 RepID=A0A5B8NNU2_9CHRO|nr:aminotransferase class I/II-fold pyridoxal phosphate-dependent enzyme [Euhalothece natronophila]QDZ40251.1 aminotransferase class I/II-fold pyridoxal phosphate-dependent enzyme [Euhalothece natronophila Z-M001]
MNTPLVDALKNCANNPHATFYVPGHKQGKGISEQLSALFGETVFRYDLPELPEFGGLFPPEGVMKTAQELAAQAFGAEKTWFLANGSTSGVMAAILATCGEGDKIILPRNVHQSAIAALIFSGAIPIFINPIYDLNFDLPYTITVEAVKQTLSQHQDAKAIFIVSPTYQGVCADIPPLATLAHSYNLPLIVDAAHGAHFGFHPQLPVSPLTQGADIVIQSLHKTLGALTQASLLHLQDKRVNPSRLSTALQCLQSSSPSHLLLASLDAAREQVETQGKHLFDYTLDLASRGKAEIEKISDLSLFNPSLPQAGCYDLDATRITINVEQLGLTGFAADEILHNELGVTAELPTAKTLTFVVTFGNTVADIEALITGLTQLRQYQPETSLVPLKLSGLPPLAECISPRKAFFQEKTVLPLADTVGKISAELVCPYPPGIPVLIPGERITIEALNYLQQVFQLGRNITITGCSDVTLKQLQVIAS